MLGGSWCFAEAMCDCGDVSDVDFAVVVDVAPEVPFGAHGRSVGGSECSGARAVNPHKAVARCSSTCSCKNLEYIVSRIYYFTVCELKMRIERNDDPKMKQKKCLKGLRREFAQCIERIPSGPPLSTHQKDHQSG